jgi:hypothetical protein
MPTPVEFMRQYRNLTITVPIEDDAARVSRLAMHTVALRKYFMMDWAEGSEEMRDYDAVTRGSKSDVWFQSNKERIRTAAMGKGAPGDYALALEWAVRAKKIATVSQAALQAYCDDHLGIDCSGFVTNYLVACRKRTYSAKLVRNTSAASYYSTSAAVDDPTSIREGDLLVWMDGNRVKSNPGHVAVVDSYAARSEAGGNMRVVEATGASGANPKLLDSMYAVEEIIPRGGDVPVMLLVVRRHGVSGSRVAVIRV